jgi:hypothetical protein
MALVIACPNSYANCSRASYPLERCSLTFANNSGDAAWIVGLLSLSPLLSSKYLLLISFLNRTCFLASARVFKGISYRVIVPAAASSMTYYYVAADLLSL